MMSDDALPLDETLWQRLMDLTQGDAALCYQCGECTAACPWGLVRQGALPVRQLLHQAQLGIDHLGEDLWLCTTCGQCQATCPRGVDIPAVFRALRQIAWEKRAVEKGLPSTLWSLYWNNNPWSQPPSQRSSWAEKLDLQPFNPDQHEVLLYVGCTSSYNRRSQKIAQSLARILQMADVPFGYLGNDEPCCGESALSMGNSPYFNEIAENTTRLFRENGVSRLVTISPHCNDVFKNHYPALVPGIQSLHYTEFLAQLLDQGRLKFEKPLDLRLTFQDPCYLGRLNGVYDAPRQVLTSIPGVELVEMKDAMEQGLCCGGGGGRMWLETPPGERFSDIRIQQAAETGAKCLATACPYCLSCLEDSAKTMTLDTFEVLDVAELAFLALK